MRDGSATRNGTEGIGLRAVAAGAAGLAYDDPMSRVLALDASPAGPARWLGYALAAVALLMGLTAGARVMGRLLALTDVPPSAPTSPQEIEVVRDEPPPPPPAPEPEPAKPDVAAAPPPPRAAPHEAPPPPQAPAQAGKVLTQEPDPNEPVDLTGNTIVSGNADSYAGGATAANGTGRAPVRGLTSPTGVSGGAPATAAAPPSGPDRSRHASVGGVNWTNAPFPPEADVAQVDDAYVTLQIDVRPDGSPSAVRVLADPGNGFGREARKYALANRFSPALDRAGNAVAETMTLRVHYSR